MEETGKSRSGLYADIASGTFPKAVKTSSRSAAWPALEVAEINAARIAGKSDDQIRALVERLHAARKTLCNGGAN